MESKLNSEEILNLKERLDFLKKSFRRRLPFQLIVIFGPLAWGIFFHNSGLLYGSVIVFFFSLYINYQISWKWIAELTLDLRRGTKSVEELKIKQIKTGRVYNEVIMNNGLRINEAEFESFGLPTSELKTEKSFLVEFSLKKGYVFNITQAIKNDL